MTGVEHAEKADLGAEVMSIGSNFEEGGGAGLEEQAVDKALVLISERRQLVREGEDHMKVGNGQEFFAPLRQPAVARPGLTLGAVPVATGNGVLSITCPGLNRFAVGAPQAPLHASVLRSA